jgi:hypothetical protein
VPGCFFTIATSSPTRKPANRRGSSGCGFMPGWCPRHGRCCAAASALRLLLLYAADLPFESLAPLTEFEEFAVRLQMPIVPFNAS